MKSKNSLLLSITALFIFTVFGRQNKQAVITGVVKDAATKSPIIEAVVTLSSSAFQGQKFAVTDSAGTYKINNLPPGKYTIIFEMEGYRKSVRDSISLKDGMSLGVNNELVKERKSS